MEFICSSKLRKFGTVSDIYMAKNLDEILIACNLNQQDSITAWQTIKVHIPNIS